MKKILSDENTKEDLEGIKRDMASLVSRLGSLKDHSLESLAEQMEGLNDVVEKYKNKGIEMGKNNLAGIYISTRKHPIRNMLCAFGAGIIACCLFNRK